ncbi:adenylate/guanylate cyclase domain-containing protein [Muricoccus aerilatus]|uniref:adenylate/guanylate cyclase domain-containing protein n=1 Tax=Muricoccus aerilatus TaxID=452982 RepID=UPI0005C2522F|nr:adenylate/guanylate cyclase domain-containing protein [Roseomonas aerilata]
MAVIAFADIVGFSVLIATDEDRATLRWLAIFHEVVTPAAERLGGRIIDVQGDGTLAEFGNVGAALEWARTLHSLRQSPGDGADLPIVFRIAIHTGSVIVEGERIFGDVVNMAARLQEYCTPGGTLLSAEVAAMLPDTEREVARDLGELPLRNLSRAARAFSLDPPGGVAVPLPPIPSHLPSLAVLPLLNLSGDPRDEYLAYGIIEDVVASLAGLRELFIVAPDSARMFAGHQPSPQRAARSLGVRFVVTGGLQRAGGGLQVSLRLADGTTGEHLWGERIHAAEHEIFQLQEHVAAQIVAGVAPSIRESALRDAMRKRPESLSAYDHMLRGLHLMAASDRAAFVLARRHLSRAVDEDPSFALPLAWISHWHSLRVGQGWSEDRAEDAAAVFSFAERALALEPSNALALAVLGHNTAYLRHDVATAMICFGQALTACPNSSVAWTLSSATLSYLGRGADAARHAEKGIRLSPYDPLRYYQQHFLSIAHYSQGSLDQAEHHGRLAIAGNAAHASCWRMQAAILAAQGRQEEAHGAAQRMMELEPGFRIAEYRARRMPFQDPAIRDRFTCNLRDAGLPT